MPTLSYTESNTDLTKVQIYQQQTNKKKKKKKKERIILLDVHGGE